MSKHFDFFNRTKKWLLVLIVGIVLITFKVISINLIFFSFTNICKKLFAINLSAASQLGEIIGGIAAFVSIYLLYLTLKEQRESSSIEKFENKYFELLKMHREDVGEIGIDDKYGKRVFVLLIREFREILSIIQRISKENNISFTNEKEVNFILSYYCLFYGTGPNSSRVLRKSLSALFPNHKEEAYKNFIESIISELGKKYVKKSAMKKRGFSFTPFEGHQSRLGHYYRLLYQMVCYVDDQKFDFDKKYEYAKTIRAQLSTHEQALLFINSLTPMGKDWRIERTKESSQKEKLDWKSPTFDKSSLVKKYRVIQNIPNEFFDEKEIDIVELLGENYFEWQE